SNDPASFVARALSPAKVSSVTIAEEPAEGGEAHGETHMAALVVVPDNQLSLAIGKKGQNARLVRGADGRVSFDGTAPGRGAYVCRDPECQERALKPARLAHAFRGPSEAKTELIETVVSGR